MKDEERICIHDIVESKPCQQCDAMEHNQEVSLSDLLRALNLIAYHLENIGKKL